MNELEQIEKTVNGSPNRLRESYFKKYNNELYICIIEYTHNLNIPFKQKIWHWVNHMPNHRLCICGNKLSFKMNWKDGYKKFCSNKCSSNSTVVKEKLRNTLISKYNVDSYSKTDEYKKKIEKTSFDKWGVSNFSKTDEYLKKSKKSYNEKYGVDSFTKTKEYLEKTIETNLIKYGVSSHTKTKKYKLERKGKSIFKNEEYRKQNFEIAKNIFYIKYLDNNESLFNCDLNENHTFIINTDNYYGRVYNKNNLCTVCYPIDINNSIKEIELYKFIKDNYSDQIIQNYKIDRMEIDIYLPDLNIGFEFNGIWWHSDKYKESNYHINKTNFFKSRKIRIIHIWEDDWINKKEIIQSQLLYFIKKINTKISARKSFIKEVSIKDSKEFLNENNLKGYIKANIRLGIYYKNDLVMMMCFSEDKKILNSWNINTLCTKNNISVMGGASKLLNLFIEKYNPKRIVSYVNKDWSLGNVYKKIGFKELYSTKVNYKYLIDGIRKSKYSNDKHFPKVYDCGKIVFELIIQ